MGTQKTLTEDANSPWWQSQLTYGISASNKEDSKDPGDGINLACVLPKDQMNSDRKEKQQLAVIFSLVEAQCHSTFITSGESLFPVEKTIFLYVILTLQICYSSNNCSIYSAVTGWLCLIFANAKKYCQIFLFC